MPKAQLRCTSDSMLPTPSQNAVHLKIEQLEIITTAMSAFLMTRDWHDASQCLLRGALQQTSSEDGFVGVLLDGPVLRILAHQGLRWHEDLNRSGYLEFTSFENLFGNVLTTGEPVISNSPAMDAGAGRLPVGDPPLRSFLGVPLIFGSDVVGMIAVANRPGGYAKTQRSILEAFASTAAVLYEGYRRSLREAELTQQLRRVQKMDAIGHLAGGIAHDFSNLLMIIAGYCGLLQNEPRMPSDVLKKLDGIQNATNRAAALTRRLLAFSRGQLLQPTIIGLNDLVRNLGGMLERLIREDIDITSFLAADLWNVKADPSQIEQVIMNLVINARDAMPSGGKLHIETSNIYLDEDFISQHAGLKPGPHVCLSVKDTGVGMDKEVLSHIFEPFFTTKKPGEGTGFGLATVYGIVKQIGGCISVRSELQHGTVFDIYLPKAEGASRAAQKSEAPVTRGSETILVVEDDEAVRSLITAGLSRDGYTVLHASNGREAETIWNEHRDAIAMVLTDVVMPVMSGPEFVRRVRNKDPKLKVIYMSGHAGDALSDDEIRSQDLILHKPFLPSILKNNIRSYLTSSQTGHLVS